MRFHASAFAPLLLSASVACSSPASSSLANAHEPTKFPAHLEDGASTSQALGIAPDLVLGAMDGGQVKLSSIWQEQGVYLVFYRGDW